MAATVTNSGDLTFISFPIEKFEKNEDGDLYVYGKATDGSVDSDEQIVDTDFSSKAIQEWLETGGNVRVQHNAQRDPAGVGVEAHTDADGTTWVKSLVVEPTAKTLVEKRALRAYSVGIARPKIVRDSVARGGRIVDGIIVEISLVDRPANKNCGIQLVKSAEDGELEYVGKMFGNSDVVTKGESVVTPDIDLTTGNSTFSPADLAKLLQHRAIAEKRQMDPNVGGGVDRDKIPDGDFAGRDRSFPIVTPGDVSDAASSIGRAGSDNYSSDQLKRNIIRIARRKGDAFVAALPESWKKELGMGKSAEVDDDVDAGTTDADDVDTKKADETAEVEKGMKDCPKCGKGYDADAKTRKCEGCGAKLPMATKGNLDEGDAPEEEKKPMEKATEEAEVEKGVACSSCKGAMPGDANFCPGCGAKKGEAEPEVEKSPTVGEGVVGTGAAATQAVPAHREPDGADFEAFEHDADMPTVPDASVKSESDEMLAAQRLKSIGAPYDLGALHDVLCSAFHPDDVAKAHPTVKANSIDVNYWMQKALRDAGSAPLEEATKSTELWQHAETLKGTELEILDEIRFEAFKSYSDAQVGPGSFPKPTELNPTSFRRPLITADHQAPSPDHAGPNTHSVPTDHIAANDFQRGPLTAGQAADSPANKSGVIEAPLPVGEPSRVYYRNGMRDKAKSAMQAMHDHIAQTFPDLCPAGLAQGNDGAAQSRPVPVPSHKANDEVAVKKSAAEKAAKKALKKLNEARAELGLETLDVTDEGVLLKGAGTSVIVKENDNLRDEIVNLQSMVAKLASSLEAQASATTKLQADVEALGNLPDPAVSAWKGAAQNHSTDTITKGAGLPVGAASVAQAAEQQRISMISALQSKIRNSSDPAEREACWQQLMKMNGYVQ